MKKKLLFLLFLLFFSVTTIPSNAAETKPPKNLFDVEPPKTVAASIKSRIEVNKNSLTIWRPAAVGSEMGVIFKNGRGARFKYRGEFKNFDLVLENFDHDAPAIFLIERNGRKHRYHLGESEPFVTESENTLLTIRTLLNEKLSPRIQLEEAVLENFEHANQVKYELRFQCDFPKENPIQDLDLKVIKFSDVEIVIELPKEASAKGSLKLIKDKSWKIADQTGVLKDIICK